MRQYFQLLYHSFACVMRQLHHWVQRTAARMMVGPVNICHGRIVLNPKREVHRRLDGRRYLRLPDATTGPDAYVLKKSSQARFPMVNLWFPSSNASAARPPLLTAGESQNPIPPLPPDPPDPDFPPLDNSPPLSHRELQTARLSKAVVSISHPPSTAGVDPFLPASPMFNLPAKQLPAVSFGSIGKANLENLETLKVIPPKPFSPVQTNRASNGSVPVPFILPPPSVNQNPILQKPSPAKLCAPSTSTVNPPQNPPLPANPPAPTLVEKIQKSENKTLRRLAPVTIAESGRPRVLIPDSVFQKGEELHKDFIICYFNGRPPPFTQIQNVLNHMWGKGKRVEIHINPLSYSMLVRIPSAYLRQKIIEKTVWYIGDSMFHAVQWSSKASFTSPPLESIQIWAHLTGVPLDLRHDDGLSLVAGLVGEPIETDDFTKNLVSLTLSHVKVAVDLTKPLPSVVEFQRQNGEIVEVMVSYPWLPPTCSHCNELGHIVKNCLQLPPQPKQVSKTPQKPHKKPPPAKDVPSTSTNPPNGSASAKTPLGSPNSTVVRMEVETSTTVKDPSSLVSASPLSNKNHVDETFKFASSLSSKKLQPTFKKPPTHSTHHHKPFKNTNPPFRLLP
ncbi:hypothetical protein YC2023_015345 [Brassica napus]